ncbi:metal tolerance protein 1-like [Magnolia sinica]|uniref:metal tolerance protein 1-like n=1 Tax=Magnolia sinica TaxID=86752 RepID=UPI002657B568|nr:metal tolerance protein 1-like [Magnolia sinica]
MDGVDKTHESRWASHSPWTESFHVGTRVTRRNSSLLHPSFDCRICVFSMFGLRPYKTLFMREFPFSIPPFNPAVQKPKLFLHFQIISSSKMEDGNVHTINKEYQREIDVSKFSKETRISSERWHCSCYPICGFSKQAKHKLEHEERNRSAKKVLGVIVLCLLFMVVEIIGGVKANSLAVLTDAAHLLMDVAGFAISLFTIWASGWDATPRQSYGFFRIEVLGALLSMQLIWLIVGFLIYEAIDRILHKNSTVDGKLMFVVAAFGFIVNLIMVVWLGHDHGHAHDHDHVHAHDHDHCGTHASFGSNEEAGEMTILLPNSPKKHRHEIGNCCQHKQVVSDQLEDTDYSGDVKQNHVIQIKGGQKKMPHKNMNIQGAYMHVVGDLIQSVGVMIGGAIIWARPTWLMVDLICTLGFSVLVVWTTISMLRSILDILMESTPDEIDAVMLESGIKSIHGVRGVHDLHVWAISPGKILLACHVTVEPDDDSNRILLNIRNYCEETYKISHITVQIEKEETTL